jgi:hypothetical protein
MTVPLRILATAIAFGAAALLAVPAVAGPGDGLEGGPTLSRYGKSLTAEASHRVGTSITVTGSASWVEATLREFGVLRATEVGRGIIHALEETGHRVLIQLGQRFCLTAPRTSARTERFDTTPPEADRPRPSVTS